MYHSFIPNESYDKRRFITFWWGWPLIEMFWLAQVLALAVSGD